MIETHTIRLRGPWECWIDEGPPRRVHMPALRQAVNSGNTVGRLRCRRRFGCPTCLDRHERVWLVIERPAQSGEAILNDEKLGPMHAAVGASEFELTNRLRDRNELVLDFDHAATAGDRPQLAAEELLFADVRLEIRG